MNKAYHQIEAQLGKLGERSRLNLETKSKLPDQLKEIHDYEIFGSDLLSVPAELIIKGDHEEYEKPFSFLDSKDGFDNFENEFRPDIPTHFIPFGYLYGASEIVLYNVLKKSVHCFHVSDIVDEEWIKYKLDHPICNFEEFTRQIKPQTVTCFIHPEDYSDVVLMELRKDKVYLDYELLTVENEASWEVYLDKCKFYLKNGMQIHYAPKKVTTEFIN